MTSNAVTTEYKLSQTPFAKAINKFVYSKWFVVAFAVLTVLSNFFALDAYYFGLVTAFAVYIAFFGKDFSPYMPMLVLCYVVSSVHNNPGNNPNSILYPSNSGYFIFYLAGIIVLSMIIRFAVDKKVGFYKMVSTKRRLAGGFIALLIAYVISGIGGLNYNDFAIKNILFGLLQFAVMIVPYFVLSFAVDWESLDKDYLCFIGVMLALTVSAELFGIYFINDVKSKSDIFTGWGISNNIGAYICMMTPFAFYFIANRKYAILNLLALDFCCVAIILTYSRTAMLAMTAILIIGNVIAFIKARPIAKVLCAINLFVVVAGEVFFIINVYPSLAELLDSNARNELYAQGLNAFYNYPLFGDGWYALNKVCASNPDILERFGWMWATEESFLSFFPGRWHNTVIQLLATGGLVGLGAYVFHRVQTCILAFKKKSSETLFIFLALILLLLQSLLDCHLFNIGPMLFYSVALAFIEFKPFKK
ncbi:MAG: O-antigen ligase family protein [Clostridiales bacterium]|nr:O-antigen ligase family protein [Clostridiales bacterium]